MIKGEEFKAVSSKILELAKIISPLPRMINSEGLDQAFEIILKEYPALKIHKYQTGDLAEDWEVPEQWKVIEGYMLDDEGKILASIDESLLFVAPYSEPVEGYFTKEEISKHVRTNPKIPDSYSLEHKNAYNYSLVDWGITLPHDVFSSLSEEKKYYIKIKVETKPGSMKVGEWFIQGESDEIISFNGHIDELCNDDLSGCLLGLEFMKFIANHQKPRFCYQLLLLPETIGTFFFFHNNRKIIQRTIGVINLETVGAGENLCLKKAYSKDSLIEFALREAIKSLNIPFKELGFFEGYGNDERVYEHPTFKVPGVALQRYPFREYHTSHDTPDVLVPEFFEEGLRILAACYEILEKNYIPRYTSFLPPWLTKNGLYFDRESDPVNYLKYNNDLLFKVDGKTSILELSSHTGLKFGAIHQYFNKFLEKGFMEKVYDRNN